MSCLRFGISNLVFPHLESSPRDEILGLCSVVDFAPTVHFGSWDNIPSVLDAHPYAAGGPRVVALQSLFFGVAGCSLLQSEEAFSRLEQHFEYLVGLAATAHVPGLIFGSPGTRAGRLPDVTDAMLEDRILRLAALALSRSTTLYFEVNSPKFGCEYLTSNSALFSLLERIPHPGLGLHLDVGQMVEEGLDVCSLLEAHGAALGHIHLSAPDFTCQPAMLPLYLEVIDCLRAQSARADVILEIQRLGDQASAADLIKMCQQLSAACGREGHP